MSYEQEEDDKMPWWEVAIVVTPGIISLLIIFAGMVLYFLRVIKYFFS